MGDLHLLGNSDCFAMRRILVVGTRSMSPYGELMTKSFVKKLVEEEWCIVSGLARGIDKIAHETCLNQGGKTIAVLAHGLDLCYPPEHERLKKRILEANGLLVSQYANGVKATPEKFKERDAVMVRLAEVVLVVESPVKSGVKTTVAAAADLGRNVYVVPGPVTQSSYHGSVEIIRSGGIPVYNPEDLIRELSYT